MISDTRTNTNNTVYDADRDIWWNPDELFFMLKTSVNPARVGYFSRILREQNVDLRNSTLLDVGCGGGILTEAFAELEMPITGRGNSGAAFMKRLVYVEGHYFKPVKFSGNRSTAE